MRRGPAAAAFLAWGAMVLAPATAVAQLALDVDGCEGLDPAAIQGGLEVELADASDAVRASHPHVVLTCSDGQVRIEIGDPITDKHVVRVVPMPEIDRDRVLTLAVAQLLLTSWLELLIDPREGEAAESAETMAREAVAEAQPTLAPVVAPPVVPAPTASPTTGEIALEAGARVRLDGENLPTAAASLRAQLVVDALLLVGLRLGVEWGRAFRERGSIDVVLTSGGVLAGLRTPSVGPFFVDGSLGLDVGVLVVEGHPSRPDAVAGGTTVAVVADGWLEVAPSFRADSVVVSFPLAVTGIAFAPDARVTGEASVVSGGAVLSAALRLAYTPR